jgi:hypothetical protein
MQSIDPQYAREIAAACEAGFKCRISCDQQIGGPE